jgi:hypothetical protein
VTEVNFEIEVEVEAETHTKRHSFHEAHGSISGMLPQSLLKELPGNSMIFTRPLMEAGGLSFGTQMKR